MITCKIYNQNEFQKQSNTLLDSGAQISLVHEETVAALALKGNNTTITLTKVGVEEETIKTKVYKVPASSPESTEMLSIRAVGILCIREEVTAIQPKPITKFLGQEHKKIPRGNGPVDLLIGNDHVQMHTGSGKLDSQVQEKHL